jgi:FKBP-type peptidyl-prolyl cis-trans isomerase
VLRPGEGSKHPKEGDQVIFHYITRTTEGVVVESSRADHGGRGAPLRMVLGKSKMIAGWEEGLPTILKGETAMLKIRPDLHYADPECPVTVAENFPKGEDLFFEIELLDFQKVKVLKDDLGVTKLVILQSFMTSILSLCHGQSSSG